VTAACVTGQNLPDLVDPLLLAGFPAGTRLICRRERPHPHNRIRHTDHDQDQDPRSNPAYGRAIPHTHHQNGRRHLARPPHRAIKWA
jgi:hypothetical protein